VSATGKDFVAVRRLSTKANKTLAVVGETCERVSAEYLRLGMDPDAGLAGLEASGKIKRAPKAIPKPAPRLARRRTEGEG